MRNTLRWPKRGWRDIEKWSDSMRVGKAGEGASVKHKAYVLLREIFRDACERELDQDGTILLKSNPVHIRMYKPTARFQYVDISMEELNTLYHAMPQRFAVVVYLSGVMGLRPGEVYGLQRRDVRLKDDLSEGVLDIVRAAKEYSPKDPETGKRHKKVLVNETKSTGSTSVEIARLLERTDVAARITLLKVMDANEREEVMRRLSPETKEETLSRMLMEPQ